MLKVGSISFTVLIAAGMVLVAAFDQGQIRPQKNAYEISGDA